jgi:hypothetical protein
MGYTHYWECQQWTEEDQKGYEEALPQIKKVLDLHKGILQSDLVANEEVIWLNGIEGHETFVFRPQTTRFDFCKTARKPYDLPVCEVLILLDRHIPNFSFRSDGEIDGSDPNDGWAEAHRGIKELFGEQS